MVRNEEERKIILENAQKFMDMLKQAGGSPEFIVETGYHFVQKQFEAPGQARDMAIAARLTQQAAEFIGISLEQQKASIEASSYDARREQADSATASVSYPSSEWLEP